MTTHTLVTTTTPRPDGRHTTRTDRGYSSVTHYWDDRSEVYVGRNDYAGTAIEYKPGPPARARSIWWVGRDELIVWLNRQAPKMPDHIWDWIAAELPDLDLIRRSAHA